MEVVLYSTHCPKCHALEMLLKKNKIEYTENNNVEEMLALGFTSAPILVVDGNAKSFSEAAQWIKER